MKGFLLFAIIGVLVFAGCDNEKRNNDLTRREEALNQREQELNLRQKTMQVQEEQLLKRQHLLDSTLLVDTSSMANPAFQGNWTVRMTCTEATCTGSAVGDSRTEEWNLSYEGSTIIAKAMSGGKLVRTYTGFSARNTIELRENKDTVISGVTMVVRLRLIDKSHLEGKREIARKDCKVIYDLKLEKHD